MLGSMIIVDLVSMKGVMTFFVTMIMGQGSAGVKLGINGYA